MEEVALGADLCTVEEAEDFLDEVPEKIPFMGTSCCPAWSVMAKKEFPEHADCICMALDAHDADGPPHPQAAPQRQDRVRGPVRRQEARGHAPSVKSEVDFVLTFEEMAGMMRPRTSTTPSLLARAATLTWPAPTAAALPWPAVWPQRLSTPSTVHPDREVKVANAEGLDECRKMMMMAKGKYDGYLLEGMACPGGCVAGAGTLADPAKSVAMLNKYKNEATMKVATETPYQDSLDLLHY